MFSSLSRAIITNDSFVESSKLSRISSTTANIGELQHVHFPITPSAEVQKYLSLKLPETMPTASLETPDITNFVSQVPKDGSSSRSAPQTADVLKTVLDMIETDYTHRSDNNKSQQILKCTGVDAEGGRGICDFNKLLARRYCNHCKLTYSVNKHIQYV